MGATGGAGFTHGSRSVHAIRIAISFGNILRLSLVIAGSIAVPPGALLICFTKMPKHRRPAGLLFHLFPVSAEGITTLRITLSACFP